MSFPSLFVKKGDGYHQWRIERCHLNLNPLQVVPGISGVAEWPKI